MGSAPGEDVAIDVRAPLELYSLIELHDMVISQRSELVVLCSHFHMAQNYVGGTVDIEKAYRRYR